MLTGGFISWYSSDLPDGLEWSIAQVTGSVELETSEAGLHKAAEEVQQQMAVLPDYALPGATADNPGGTTLAGLVGSLMVLLLTGGVAFILRRRTQKNPTITDPYRTR